MAHVEIYWFDNHIRFPTHVIDVLYSNIHMALQGSRLKEQVVVLKLMDNYQGSSQFVGSFFDIIM